MKFALWTCPLGAPMARGGEAGSWGRGLQQSLPGALSRGRGTTEHCSSGGRASGPCQGGAGGIVRTPSVLF